MGSGYGSALVFCAKFGDGWGFPPPHLPRADASLAVVGGEAYARAHSDLRLTSMSGGGVGKAAMPTDP